MSGGSPNAPRGGGGGASAPPPGPGYAFEDPVGRVRGIGPRWAAELGELGVVTVGDLLLHLPFRYVDRRRLVALGALRPGEPATAVAIVRDVRTAKTRRRGIEVLHVTLDDGTGMIRASFYGRAYLADYIREGARLLVYGTPRFADRTLELPGPDFEVLREGEDPLAQAGWVPVYEKLGPLSGRRLRTTLANALAGLEAPRETIPAELVARWGLPSLAEALAQVHAPAPETPAEELETHTTAGHKRLAYDEFFLLELGLALRRARRRLRSPREGFRVDDAMRARLSSLVPFALTGAQRRVLAEIEEDLKQPFPMHRLLLGDVGSGKTIVAALAMMIAVENGRQAVLMAPTEILARQHAGSLGRLLAARGIRVELLSASLPASRQREARGRFASGQAKVGVGTHALLSEGVRFARLGLVVVDEQHRFGVEQRAGLGEKGPAPDVLVMSATPIPRTLAMTRFGDLDVSILDEKPPGRKPIRTIVRGVDERERVMAGLRTALDEGRRVYVVRPAVEEGPRGLRAAEEGLAEYGARFPDVPVVMVHGRMKAAERDASLAAFREGRARILVATTVIEVGIDVPEASVIVVEDADRFGLAQLHQLRGRVGRGAEKSYCVLIASEDAGKTARQRLMVLADTDDGFRVAERDLELRGPGELAGTAQSGMPSFRVGDVVRHRDILVASRRDAFELLERVGEEGLPEELARETLRRHGARLRLVDVG